MSQPEVVAETFATTVAPTWHDVAVLLTVTTTLEPATDLGYLLVMFGIGAWLAERNLTKRMAG